MFAHESGYAGEVLKSYVNDDGDHYLLNLEMRINADAQRVYQLLTDFNHLNKISDSVTSSKILSQQGKRTRVEVHTEGCVLVFCKHIKQVQTVTELGGGYLMIVDDPEAGDFTYGRTLWRIWQEGNHTRVSLSADVVPKFWLPPLVGPWVFKDKLLNEGETLINGLESSTTP